MKIYKSGPSYPRQITLSANEDEIVFLYNALYTLQRCSVRNYDPSDSNDYEKVTLDFNNKTEENFINTLLDAFRSATKELSVDTKNTNSDLPCVTANDEEVAKEIREMAKTMFTEPKYHWIYIDVMHVDLSGEYYRCRSKEWLESHRGKKTNLHFSTYVHDIIREKSLERWYNSTLKESYKRLLYEDYLKDDELDHMEFNLELQFLTGWIYLVNMANKDQKMFDLLSHYGRKNKKKLTEAEKLEYKLLSYKVVIINNLGYNELNKQAIFDDLYIKYDWEKVKDICNNVINNKIDVIEESSDRLKINSVLFSQKIGSRLAHLQNNLDTYIAGLANDDEKSLEAHYYLLDNLLQRVEREFGMKTVDEDLE